MLKCMSNEDSKIKINKEMKRKVVQFQSIKMLFHFLGLLIIDLSNYPEEYFLVLYVFYRKLIKVLSL